MVLTPKNLEKMMEERGQPDYKLLESHVDEFLENGNNVYHHKLSDFFFADLNDQQKETFFDKYRQGGWNITHVSDIYNGGSYKFDARKKSYVREPTEIENALDKEFFREGMRSEENKYCRGW